MLARILPRVQRRVFTYGMVPAADYVARLLPAAQDGCRSRFEVAVDRQVLGPFDLHVPGRHNVLNATAAVAVGHQLELKPEQIAAGLHSFRGVDRRFQIKGVVRGVTVIDDYGHHPTEIRATLRAARECGYGRVHVIFQPHRYTRTRDLMAEFASCFEDADSVEVIDIYAASEEPIPGITGEVLARAAGRETVRYAASIEEAIRRTALRTADGDAVMTLGAGSISQAAPRLLGLLADADLER